MHPHATAAGAVASAAYLWLRRERLWRFEIPALSAFCALFLLLYQPVAALVVVALFLACLACGCRFARLFGVPLATPADVLTEGFGLGAALLIPVLFVLGLLRLYYWRLARFRRLPWTRRCRVGRSTLMISSGSGM